MRKFEDYVYGDHYNGILAQLVAENRSLLYLVPGNGNYVGNAANDAWIRWTAYAQAELGYVGEVPRNATGEARIMEWMEEYFERYPDSDPFDIDVIFNIPARLHSTQSELPGIDPFSIVPEAESIMG